MRKWEMFSDEELNAIIFADSSDLMDSVLLRKMRAEVHKEKDFRFVLKYAKEEDPEVLDYQNNHGQGLDW